MKIRTNNQHSQRVLRRFKWLSIAGVGMIALHYAMEQGMKSIEHFQFVNAAADEGFEADEVYSSYIESAKLQQKLMQEQHRQAHQPWTMDQYRRFQARKLESEPVKTDLQILQEKILKYQDAKFKAEDVPAEATAAEKQGQLERGKELLALMQDGAEDWHKLIPADQWDNIPEIVADKATKFNFKKETFNDYIRIVNSQGFVDEYWATEERCFSGMINVPGISLLPVGLMGVAYLLFLGYLFLGIAISADIFMEAIEVITSKTQLVEIQDVKSEGSYLIEVPLWNPTMANLTLMAFGSSAPEIILSVLEAVKELGKPAGELGPSTIVGSAAFNLLVISAVSVAAVGGPSGEVKKVDDMGVFATTGVFSIFAYIWLYVCLAVNSEGQVEISEAVLTFGFFFLLLILAFGADKFNQRKKAKVDHENTEKENLRKMKKSKLRSIAKMKGEAAVLAAAQGQQRDKISEEEMKLIKDLYMEILEVNELSSVSLGDLLSVLKPETLFERFAARKANQVGATKEFMEIKGQKFQIENTPTTPVLEENEVISFKCLHYSVTESAGMMHVTIIKKNLTMDCTVGVRTRDGTAVAGKEFSAVDTVVSFTKKETEKTVEVEIHDNHDWQPDMDFFVELYDTKNNERLYGGDTETKITILDEDFPGKLGFEATEIIASRQQDKVDIIINRVEGTDGKISCMIRTEPLIQDSMNNALNAIEFEDYLPKHEKIEFASGESAKVVSIQLVRDSVAAVEGKAKDIGIEKPEEQGEEENEDEDFGPRFKVVLEKPEPQQVKISKKNCCTVELKSTSKDDNANEEHSKMINYFVSQKNPGWAQQFRQAVMLCPKVDEDDLIVSEVTLWEALCHFATMGWKILFSLIPPCEWGGGWPAFVVALIFIGAITAIVAEVATVLGCTLGLKPAVTAITLVAIGTSLPDTFASKTAAQQSEYADSAIGNVTGSNSVNVFVGLGLPWLISAGYAAGQYEEGSTDPWNGKYQTPPGTLAFSVMLFLITSLTCFLILGLRRLIIGGELGGSPLFKYITAAVLTSLWLVYVTFSTLKAYGQID